MASEKQPSITLGRDFAIAACEHFGLPANKVCDGLQLRAGGDEILHLEVCVIVSAEDLEAIAKRMSGRSA